MQVFYEIRWPPELPSSKNHLFVSAADIEEANLVHRSNSFVITGSVCFFSLKPLKELSLKISCEVYMKKQQSPLRWAARASGGSIREGCCLLMWSQQPYSPRRKIYILLRPNKRLIIEGRAERPYWWLDSTAVIEGSHRMFLSYCLFTF